MFLISLFGIYSLAGFLTSQTTRNHPTPIVNENLIYDESGYIQFQESYSIYDIESFESVDMISRSGNYSDFMELLEEGDITEVYAEFSDIIEESNTFYYFTSQDSYCYKLQNPLSNEFKQNLLEKDVKVYGKAYIFQRVGLPTPVTNGNFINSLTDVFYLVIMLIMLGYFLSMGRNMFNSREKQADIQQVPEDRIKSFDDIGGLKEVKKDLLGLVDFIKNSDKYIERNATLPTGVLLVGPPGTGKTLLARAIAKEAGVPFYYMNGSDFVEMFVGLGAKRVRDLFKKAKKNSPCIIFIDEIDTLCSKRGVHDSHSEDRKTLTALLSEMDGFEKDTKIMVIGATNRIEDIDEAVLRPGRFTDIYQVPLPESMDERMEIINIYIRNKKLSDNVDLQTFAKEMIGRSPAEIEAVINEATIISVQKGLPYINKQCLDEAFYKRVMRGHQKESNDTSEDELRIIAFHEAGHALMAKLNHHSVTKVTIIPSTSGTGGVTFIQPEENKLYTQKMLKDQVCELYGGAVSEYLFNGKDWEKVTTGCSNDIKHATLIMKDMVERYGMSDYGLININILKGKGTQSTVDYVKKLSEDLLKETISKLEANYTKLEKIAEELLEKEVLYEADIDLLLSQLPPPDLYDRKGLVRQFVQPKQDPETGN